MNTPQDDTQAGIDTVREFMNLDGTGGIDFYENLSSCWAAPTTVVNSRYHPADSFVPSPNATYGNVVFDGLKAGETVTLGAGKHGAENRFYNVKFENVTGGEIVINDYTTVNNLDVKGAECAVTIGGRAQLNDLHAEGAHFLRLTAEPGAQIVRGNFNGCTIDMASDLNNSIWRNCEFTNATLRNVDFQGAQLSDTHFVGTDLSGVNFTGARLSNCSISGTDISTINAQTAHFHNVSIEVNGKAYLINSTAEFIALQQAVQVGRGMAESINAVRAPETGPVTMAGLGSALGQQADTVTLAAQQAAGAGASPAEARPAPSQDNFISF